MPLLVVLDRLARAGQRVIVEVPAATSELSKSRPRVFHRWVQKVWASHVISSRWALVNAICTESPSPVSNDIAGVLRRMQPRWQRYRGGSQPLLLPFSCESSITLIPISASSDVSLSQAWNQNGSAMSHCCAQNVEGSQAKEIAAEWSEASHATCPPSVQQKIR